MRFFLSNFKWLMFVSGLLTCSMFLGLFDPSRSIHMNFGETMSPSPSSQIVVRNWSGLIGLVGVMLVYGSFVPAVRKFVLVIAGVSKIIFIALVILYLPNFMNYSTGVAVIADSLMVILYAVYIALDRETVP